MASSRRSSHTVGRCAGTAAAQRSNAAKQPASLRQPLGSGAPPRASVGTVFALPQHCRWHPCTHAFSLVQTPATDATFVAAGAPKFLFDEDPTTPGGDGGGLLGATRQFASVFKASRTIWRRSVLARSNVLRSVFGVFILFSSVGFTDGNHLHAGSAVAAVRRDGPSGAAAAAANTRAVSGAACGTASRNVSRGALQPWRAPLVTVLSRLGV